MTRDQYATLSDRDKIFMDVLQEIAAGIKKLGQDISRDLEETVH